jgi:hypothetical protein
VRHSQPPTPIACSLDSVHRAAPPSRPRRPIVSDEVHARPGAPPSVISRGFLWKPPLPTICPLSAPHPPPRAHRHLAVPRKPAERSRLPGRPTPAKEKVAVTRLSSSPSLLGLEEHRSIAQISLTLVCLQGRRDQRCRCPRSPSTGGNRAHFPPLHARSLATIVFPDLDLAASDPRLTPATLVSLCTTKP